MAAKMSMLLPLVIIAGLVMVSLAGSAQPSPGSLGLARCKVNVDTGWLCSRFCPGVRLEHVTTRRQPVVRTGEAPNLGREPENQTRIGLTAEVRGFARLNRRPHGRGHESRMAQQLGKLPPPENKLSTPTLHRAALGLLVRVTHDGLD